jgi:hypothetical protein
MKVDFHLHTHWSDGALAPEALRKLVDAAGVQHYAVTDHDTLAGFRALQGDPRLVPGVEITTWIEDTEIHIVGLGIDPDHQPLNEFLLRIRAGRRIRLAAIAERIASRGGPRLDLAALLPAEPGCPTRGHLAGALVKAGAADHKEVFPRWLSEEALHGLDAPDYPHPTAAAAAIHAAGGLAILAHPARYKNMDFVGRILDAGLDGLEVAHPRCPAPWPRMLESMANSRGLLMSCGSDLHHAGHRQPGDHQGPRPAISRLLDRLGIHRAAA